MLYQVSTAALSLVDNVMSIHQILRQQGNTQVRLGCVEAIDREASNIHLNQIGQPIPYDYLLVATGACHMYFCHEDWEPFAPGLKAAEVIIGIRHRVLAAFEKAEVMADADERRRLLSFVVIGRGPTGVEMAGAIAELAKAELAMQHRALKGQRTHVTLFEAGPRLLLAFPESLVEKARNSFEHLGAEVLTGTAAKLCGAIGTVAAGELIRARTLI